MPALLNPGEPVPVRLMNTIWADRAGRHDDIDTVEDLRIWLDATRRPEERADVVPGPGDLERFRRLRDALRRLAAFQTDDARPHAVSPTEGVEEAIAEVNEAATRSPAWPALTLSEGRLRRGVAGDGGQAPLRLSSVAVQAIDLFTGPDGHDLRACYGPRCVQYFVKDHPRREWCSSGCGNRARAARHYARHRDR